MSISTTTRKAGPFTGNGATASFPFTFKVFAAADLLVVRGEIATSAEVELTLGTHYSVTLNSNQDTTPGGSVNWIGTPLSSAFTLTIGSKVAMTQPASFTNLGRFYPRALNDALDRLTIVVQQLGEQVGRSVKVGFSGLVSPDELVNTITTAASTAAAAATDAAAAATTAVGLVDDAQVAIDAANAASAGALQKSGGTMTGALVLPGNAVNPLEAVPKQQAEAIASAAAASAVADRMRVSLAASQPTTSGTAVDFTGVPSWAKRITVQLVGVSCVGAGYVGVRLGTGVTPTYVTSGYLGCAWQGPNFTNFTDLMAASSQGLNVDIRHGTLVLTRVTGNTWVSSSVVSVSNAASVGGGAFAITLGDVLTAVRLTTHNGDTFDAGSASILIEG